MIQKKLLPIVLLYFLFSSILLKGQTGFHKHYGGLQFERAQNAFQDFNGNYIINGWSNSVNSSGNPVILQSDASGNILSGVSVRRSPVFEFNEYVIDGFNGQYICAGRLTNVASDTSIDASLYSIDISGQSSFSNIYKSINSDGLIHVSKTSDEGYIAAGYANAIGLARDLFIVKTDSSGNELFQKVYHGSKGYTGTNIFEIPGGDFILSGVTTYSVNLVTYKDAFVARLDPTGNFIWSKLFSDSSLKEFNAVRLDLNNHLILTGSKFTIDSTGLGDFDILLAKLDLNGNLLWSKVYGGQKADAAYDVNVDSNGDYLISGYSESIGHGHRIADDSLNVFLLKVSVNNGSPFWCHTYGDGLQDEVYRSSITSDGSVLMSGLTTNYTTSANGMQILFIKDEALSLPSSGCHQEEDTVSFLDITLTEQGPEVLTELAPLTVIRDTISSNPVNLPEFDACTFVNLNEKVKTELTLFPNPTTGNVTVQSLNLIEEVIVSDYTGKTILKLHPDKLNYEINLSGQPAGIYFVRFSGSESPVVKKVVKN